MRERETDRTHDHRPMMPRISEEERREKERERGRENEREIKQVLRYSLVCRHLALVHTLQFPSRRRPTDLNLPGARFLT